MPLTDLAARSSIHLSAIDPARNCDRRYRIERSPDLFGEQIIELSWGRAGCRGQTKRLSAPSRERAISLVRSVLARRDTALVRIGTAYRSDHSET
ncbi:WGR domain-containing protein [Erythrobacter litoralis]|uniref:WGR domain-containing protein n=1 Tax=Erythrobacter litoralis TaxID=39960 RepID=UPI0024352C30|nr:WGR domain-containing protein [Erythrobacter litoralis]MDG6080263.1 WGR domain-containing protein [Erythrobacter litoralis]